MHFLIEAVYSMTWIWTLHRAHNQWKSPIEEDNVWAMSAPAKSMPEATVAPPNGLTASSSNLLCL